MKNRIEINVKKTFLDIDQQQELWVKELIEK
jgi:hypothetical protein